jgi:hypothetical protein
MRLSAQRVGRPTYYTHGAIPPTGAWRGSARPLMVPTPRWTGPRFLMSGCAFDEKASGEVARIEWKAIKGQKAKQPYAIAMKAAARMAPINVGQHCAREFAVG